jgi:hypothetical protein
MLTTEIEHHRKLLSTHLPFHVVAHETEHSMTATKPKPPKPQVSHPTRAQLLTAWGLVALATLCCLVNCGFFVAQFLGYLR